MGAAGSEPPPPAWQPPTGTWQTLAMIASTFRILSWPLRAAAVIALLGAFAAASPARAQDADKYSRQDWDAARALFAEGMRLLEARRYEEACGKFEASMARVPGVGTHGKLAECYERMGRTASAWQLYREIIALAREKGDGKLEAIARERARRLEPSLSYLTIDAGALADLGFAVIVDNGREVPTSEWGKARAVDPGEHLVVAYAKDHAPWEQRVRIGRGEARTVAVPRLVADIGQPGRYEAAGPAAGASAGEPPVSLIGESDRGSRGRRLAGLSLLGAGAAGLAAGGYFALTASRAWGEVEARCPIVDGVARCTDPADARVVDQSRRDARVASVALGAGAALAVTGAILWWTGRGTDDTGSLAVAPAIAPAGGATGGLGALGVLGVRIRGRF